MAGRARNTLLWLGILSDRPPKPPRPGLFVALGTLALADAAGLVAATAPDFDGRTVGLAVVGACCSVAAFAMAARERRRRREERRRAT